MGEMEVVAGQLFDQIGIQDLAIQEMNMKALTLKINGIEDRKGYEIVHGQRMFYVKMRTSVEKHGKKQREAAVKYQKDVIAEEKRVVAMLAIGENHLIAEEKAVDDALEVIRLEKVRQQEEIIQGRRNRLAALGVCFNGQMWSYGTLSLPEPMLKVSSDEQFEGFYNKFLEAVEAEKRRLEAERIAREEEAKRVAEVAAKQKAEEERLEALAKELAQKEIARVAAEAAEQRRKETQERIEAAEREKELEALRAERDRTRREQEEWERIKKAELDAIEAAKQKAIKDEADRKQKILDDERRALELENARKEAAEKARLQAIADAQKAEADRIEKERLAKIAADKKEARRPDKERLLAFAKTEYFYPDMKTEEGRTIIYVFKTGMDLLVNELKGKAVAL